MGDILNLDIKDDTLNDVISKNPFYIDIKGSVNICLIRCGQEIETCNNITFSTMINYGKVLVLNPDPSIVGTCNIKLAFDTMNDTTNNNGDSKYKFEKAFVTVPSLHKLNGQLSDLETFMIFSSTQKNGNKLYVCLCSLSMVSDIPKSGDPKLLNYKLFDELFSKNNTVPDMYKTSNFNGAPNPVDLANFIPRAGSRNFYDYTHPLNTKVNFRVFQTQLAVSSNVLSILKSKLTPGDVYTNFRNAITKTLNPVEGLFFYFSEDLTDRYKSYEANKPDESKDLEIKKNEIDNSLKEKFGDIDDDIDDNIDNDVNSTKDQINKSDVDNTVNTLNTQTEPILSILPTNNIVFIIFIISIIFVFNYLLSFLINNIFDIFKIIKFN